MTENGLNRSFYNHCGRWRRTLLLAFWISWSCIKSLFTKVKSLTQIVFPLFIQSLKPPPLLPYDMIKRKFRFWRSCVKSSWISCNSRKLPKDRLHYLWEWQVGSPEQALVIQTRPKSALVLDSGIILVSHTPAEHGICRIFLAHEAQYSLGYKFVSTEYPLNKR